MTAERLTHDISTDLRRTGTPLAVEAADKLDGLIALLAEAERARDLAVAHDRQPYPTADAYEAVCLALEAHKAERDELRAKLAERFDQDWLDRAGDAISERTFWGNSLRDMTAERDRLAAALTRVRDLHAPQPGWERDWKNPVEALAEGWPSCAGCATSVTFTPVGACRTLAALNTDPADPAPQVWGLPAEPGPEVTAVRDRHRRIWWRLDTARMGTRWRLNRPGEVSRSWRSVLDHAPLTDATSPAASGQHPDGV